MRNWHKFLLQIPGSTHPQVSDITYEELTRKTETQSFDLLMVGHYLWGIDTDTLTATNFCIYYRILSDITYEELTPIISLKYYITNFQSDITYEELTQIHMMCCVFYKRIMSDITYEELTQTNLLSDRFPTYSRRTLPMRNWHTSIGID